MFPGGCAKEHINHYTREGLERELESLGLTVLECRYVGGSEMIFLSPGAERRARASHDRRELGPTQNGTSVETSARRANGFGITNTITMATAARPTTP